METLALAYLRNSDWAWVVPYLTLAVLICGFVENYLWKTCAATSKWFWLWKLISAIGNLGPATKSADVAIGGIVKAAETVEDAARKSQRGFSSLLAAAAILGVAVLLSGCSEMQSLFTSGLSSTVSTVQTVSQDAIAAGKAAICNSSYQVVANAEVADTQGMGKAVPALCPAVGPTPVQPTAPAAPSTTTQ